MNNTVAFQNRTSCIKGGGAENCKKFWRKELRLNDHETNLGEFDVIYCSKCKLGFTNPYPTEETTGYLYEAKNSSDFDVVKHTAIDKVKDFLSVKLLQSLINPHKKINLILDYATGNGRFAVSASKAFPKAHIDAVDYQNQPPPLLHGILNNICYISLMEYSQQSKQYDLIILRHVLEHTHHPIELLKNLAGRLSSDGVLYIEVPNFDSGCAKVFGRYWKNYYVPRHIFHFTIDSLTEIINLAGLECEVYRNEMPLMGNTISILSGLDASNFLVKCLGVLLHPIQLLIEVLFRSSTCINARCRHKI